MDYGRKNTGSDPKAYGIKATVLFLRRRYPEAIQEGERAVSFGPAYQPGFHWLYRANLQLGENASALSARASDVAAWGNLGAEQYRLNGLYQDLLARGGRQGVASFLINEVRQAKALTANRYNRAVWRMWAGDQGQALTELEEGVKARPYHIIYVAVDPIFLPLHGHPRFRAVATAVGLGHVPGI